MSAHQKADYSIASQEERDQVIEILKRNREAMLAQKKVKDAKAFKKLVQEYIDGVAEGAVYTGKKFETLLKIFRQERLP